MRLWSLAFAFFVLGWCAPATTVFGGPPTLAVGSIESLTEMIRSPENPAVRMRAAESLALYGAEAMPVVHELLAERDLSIQYAACLTLTRMGPEGRAAVPELIKIASDSQNPLRETAVFALGAMGPYAAPAASVLHELAKGEPSSLRDEALEALQRIGPAAIPALADLLGHEEVTIRRQAATTLRDLGAAAAGFPGIEVALVRALNDSDQRVCDQAALALSALDRQGAEALRALLDDESPDVRRRAAMALAQMEAIPAHLALTFHQALSDTDAAVRFWAAKALGAIDDPLASASLIVALRDADADVRWQAVVSLARQGVTEAALAPLSELLNDSNSAVRTQAEKALQQFHAAP